MASASPSHRVVKPLKVHQPVFLGVIWGGLAMAIICCCLRFLARIQTFKKLLADDYFVVIALVFTIASAIIWQIDTGTMFRSRRVWAGLELPGADFVSVNERYYKSLVAVFILFFSSLWSIKISFLLFFRRLGKNVLNEKLIWWPVFCITVATYFVCLGTIPYSCLVRPFEYLITYCTSPKAEILQQLVLKLTCTWDVLTDFLSRFIGLYGNTINVSIVMSIPITMLWGVQMPWRRKAALAVIFSLVIITMIIAIVRAAVVGSARTRLPDSSWLFMWSSIEVSVAITVACLASFRNLFSSQHRHKRYVPPNEPNRWLRGTKPRSRLRRLVDTLASAPDDDIYSTYQVRIESGSKDSRSAPAYGYDSYDQIPLHKAVHVRNEIDLVNEPAQV